VKHPDLAAFAVSRETADRLVAFVDLLLAWNRRINLISRRDEADVWSRHVCDALQLAAYVPAVDFATDLGSGAGFPGLILAIATGIRFDLVETDQRKAAFLREAVRCSGAPAVVHAARAERLNLAPAPLVTARALAPLSALLGLSAPLLAPNGICLLPKGQNVANELTDAEREWHMRVERFPSRTDPTATILRISEIRRVGPAR
jgi:16S rRNA (guanine527-N7)-methyltransferase